MRWTIGLGVMTLALQLLAVGCEKPQAPVAKLTVQPSTMDLPYPARTSLRLRWQMERPLGEVSGAPSAFVHLIDSPGNVLRTFDHRLEFDWRQGRAEEYEIPVYQSVLAPPLEKGDYRISVGLYDSSGRRWPLEVSGTEIDTFEYQVAELQVPGETGNVPMFLFSQAWMPLEAGTDVQILGRRWLGGEGTIRVVELVGRGEVWLLARIPSIEPDAVDLDLDEGAEAPVVEVSSSCGEQQIAISGTGTHSIRLPIGSQETLPEECEILFRPNFQMVERSSLARRSMVLEVLTWTADQGRD
jgi:hypothetical protein